MNSLSNGNAIARPRFTSPDPNVFRIFGVKRDGADGLRRLFVKNGAKSSAAVVGFPVAAAGRADKERNFTRRFSCRSDGGDATAHGCRTNVSRTQTGDCCGSKRRFLGIDGSHAKKKRCEYASHSNSESVRESGTACEIKKGSHSVLRKLW